MREEFIAQPNPEDPRTWRRVRRVTLEQVEPLSAEEIERVQAAERDEQVRQTRALRAAGRRQSRLNLVVFAIFTAMSTGLVYGGLYARIYGWERFAGDEPFVQFVAYVLACLPVAVLAAIGGVQLLGTIVLGAIAGGTAFAMHQAGGPPTEPLEAVPRIWAQVAACGTLLGLYLKRAGRRRAVIVEYR